jgi:sporulation protein YlmC with PRC-barrel domain
MVTNFNQFKVVGTDNEQLGSFNDLVIDLTHDMVTYVAIEEVNTANDKIKDAANKQITLDMRKQQLESRPSFGFNNWPETAICFAQPSILTSFTIRGL